MRRTANFHFALIICLAVIGCASRESWNLSSSREVRMPEFILHHAFSGETMAGIAKWYTGEESNWKELARYNPGLDPWNLKRWDLVKIPLRMATVHQRPPEYSTAPKKQKKRTQETPAAQDSGSEESEEFFGPR
jgi:hypothetical protein